MKVQGFVTKIGEKSGTSPAGKAWTSHWVNIEGAFFSLGNGVKIPSECRQIVAQVNAESRKGEDKETGEEKYFNSNKIVGWEYLPVMGI